MKRAAKLSKAVGFKALGNGKPVSDEQLEKINQFSLVDLTADDVYVRRYLIAHNGIDRDVERFNEDLLEQFSETLPGKGFFVAGHPSGFMGTGGPGEGLFFDTEMQTMSPEEFKELTGEEIMLPDTVSDANALFGHAYILRLDSNIDTLKRIDAGIAKFVSIGFKAPLEDVTDKQGNSLYGEYRPNGEALEASIVWAGAQPGASAMKCADCGTDIPKQTHQTPQKGDRAKMKEFLKRLAERLGKSFSEESAVEGIVTLVQEKDARIADLEPLAKDGKAYRDKLVEDTVRYGAMIGEIPTDPEEQKTKKEFIATWPIAHLEDACKGYEKRARDQFPDKFTYESTDEADRKKREGDAQKKGVKEGGKKDYTNPDVNPLFGTVGK